MHRLVVGAALASVMLSSAGFAEERAIIAVFPIEDRTETIPDKEVSQLTDYFGVKIAETGRFIVVPQADLEKALKAAKVASYKSCVDESCQIEIGKELAAQKVLRTQIVQVGDQCAVTATLYDLRIAATEKAASVKGACNSNAFVASLEQTTTKLAGTDAPEPVAKAAPPPPPAPKPATWSLRVDAAPEGADVLVSGRRVGSAPQTVKVPKDGAVELAVEAEGFEPYTETVRLDRDERRNVALRMTAARKRARTEWFGVSLAGGLGLSGAIDLGAWIRLFNMHFGSLTLTPLDAFFGVSLASHTTASNCPDAGTYLCEEGVGAPHFVVGPRFGYKLTFADDHNLEFSLGAALMAVIGSDDDYLGPAIGPSIRYLHIGDGAFSWGIGIRGLIPVLPKSCDGVLADEEQLSNSGGAIAVYAQCANAQPYFIQLEVPLGGYF
ncbi:MAG: PEGA domain-containing protein [Deltaproteobacteria bacterium]|jgi:hypothetical protein